MKGLNSKTSEALFPLELLIEYTTGASMALKLIVVFASYSLIFS